jgi:hypothetical protein
MKVTTMTTRMMAEKMVIPKPWDCFSLAGFSGVNFTVFGGMADP